MHRLSVALICLAVSACAATDDGRCRTDGECASGSCGPDGRCVDPDVTGGGGAGGDGGTGAGGAGGDGGTGAGGAGGACLPDHDGVITQPELPIVIGLSEKLLSAQDVSFDTAGVDAGDGSRVWDFSGAQPGDHLTIVETRSIDGAWYADQFPNADYAARLADSEELLGVFEIASDALLLRGVVSPQDGVTRTALDYDPPVPVLDLPLTEGKTWNASTTVSGIAQGVAVFYNESYAFDVDARGSAITPFATFDVLRVHNRLTRVIAAVTTVTQSHVFMSECLGSVAAVLSQPNELATEFSAASEIRRLTP